MLKQISVCCVKFYSVKACHFGALRSVDELQYELFDLLCSEGFCLDGRENAVIFFRGKYGRSEYRLQKPLLLLQDLGIRIGCVCRNRREGLIELVPDAGPDQLRFFEGRPESRKYRHRLSSRVMQLDKDL